jgi:hypothetical protein
VLRAQVLVTANGNQRFTVDVMLAVGVGPEEIPTVLEVVEDVLPVVPVATLARPRRPR